MAAIKDSPASLRGQIFHFNSLFICPPDANLMNIVQNVTSIVISRLNVIVIYNAFPRKVRHNTTWNYICNHKYSCVAKLCQCIRKWNKITNFLSFLIQFFYVVFQIQHGLWGSRWVETLSAFFGRIWIKFHSGLPATKYLDYTNCSPKLL